MSGQWKAKAIRESTVGIRVAKSLAASVTANIFNVYGRVKINLLIGQVTTAESSGATVIKLTMATSTVDLCADTTVTGDAAGTMYFLCGDKAVILNGTGNTPVIDVGSAMAAAGGFNPVIVGREATADTLDLTASTPSATLVIKWVAFYVPLDDGAYLTAA